MEKKFGIDWVKPKVILLKDSGLGISELAARTCYDSYEQSENEAIRNVANGELDIEKIHEVENSDLLNKLAWVAHHHSILEHSVLSFFIQGTSRGVLQEHARHRIQSISVKSTRYTMSDILYAFIASIKFAPNTSKETFIKIVKELDMFVVKGGAEIMEIIHLYEKLLYQYMEVEKNNFFKMALSEENLEKIMNKSYEDPIQIFKALQKGKKKRNVGDQFKWVVTDNWKVDMIVTFNIRSLKNYFDLRDSGAAYFQIKWLAEEIKKQTPIKYLRLIDKKHKPAKV